MGKDVGKQTAVSASLQVANTQCVYRHSPWLAHSQSRTVIMKLKNSTSKPKCNLRIFLNTRLQAMMSLIVGVSALFGDWIVNSWRAGCHPLFSLYGTYSSALLRWKLRTMTVFSLRSACYNFLLGEEIKAPVLSLCSQTELL